MLDKFPKYYGAKLLEKQVEKTKNRLAYGNGQPPAEIILGQA